MLAWCLAAAWGLELALATPPDEVRARTRAAVERSVRSLPWYARPVARPALNRAAWTCGALSLRIDDRRVTVRCDDKDAVTVPFGDEAAGVGPSGAPYRATATRSGDVVELRFTSDRGTRIATLRVAEEGVTCTRRVHTAALPVPVVWTVSYRVVDRG